MTRAHDGVQQARVRGTHLDASKQPGKTVKGNSVGKAVGKGNNTGRGVNGVKGAPTCCLKASRKPWSCSRSRRLSGEKKMRAESTFSPTSPRRLCAALPLPTAPRSSPASTLFSFAVSCRHSVLCRRPASGPMGGGCGLRPVAPGVSSAESMLWGRAFQELPPVVAPVEPVDIAPSTPSAISTGRALPAAYIIIQGWVRTSCGRGGGVGGRHQLLRAKEGSFLLADLFFPGVRTSCGRGGGGGDSTLLRAMDEAQNGAVMRFAGLRFRGLRNATSP